MHLWHPLNGPICPLEAVMDRDTQIYFQLFQETLNFVISQQIDKHFREQLSRL